MIRIRTDIFRLLAVFVFLCSCFAARTLAQNPQPAPTLPPGMTGSDVNDPRYKLSPGLYDAGEAAMGMKHLILLKKPDAFQLGSDDPDSPAVQKTLSTVLGIGDSSKIPKSDSNSFSRSSVLPIRIWRFRAITCFKEIFTVSASMTFPIRRRPNC